MKKSLKEKFIIALHWTKQNSVILLPIFILILLADVFIFDGTSDRRIVIVLLTYWLYIRFNNLKSKITFLIALTLLIGMFTSFVIEGPSIQTERLAVWVVLFLGFGIIQQWGEASR